jgi:hypothetical protein
VEEIVVPVAIVAALVALLVAAAIAFTARRLTVARRGASFDCSLRRSDGHWSLGVARYGNDRIEWFRVFSFSFRPLQTWLRDDLSVVGHRPTKGAETTAVLPQAVVVRCRHRDDELDLAMSEDAYTGLASWIESAPPGRHARVT